MQKGYFFLFLILLLNEFKQKYKKVVGDWSESARLDNVGLLLLDCFRIVFFCHCLGGYNEPEVNILY